MESCQVLLLDVVISALAAFPEELSLQMGVWDVMAERLNSKAHMQVRTHLCPEAIWARDA